jgi:hypothetical protein
LAILLAQNFKLATALSFDGDRRERKLCSAFMKRPVLASTPPNDWISNISRHMSRDRDLQKSNSTWTDASKV